MFEVWGIGLFRKVEFALMAFYSASVIFILSVIYFVYVRLGFEQWDIIAIGIVLITVGIGKILSKMAISPLKEHFDHLETFSKETLHELNLPISTILTNVAMLRKTHTDEKSLKRLERVELAAQMLQDRYNELDYLIKKQMEREAVERVEIATIIQERVNFLQGLYPHVQWHLDLEPLWSTLDPIGLRKVIDNLIDNGVKYSPTSPKIMLTLKNNVLRICDEGIGMDEITLMKVYERYYQNDSAMSGFGIGLHLVKRYCDRYAIALQIHSAPSQGTCIALEFNEEASV